MKINIETIPNKDQRYPTCGDYWYDENGVLQIRVSELGNRLFEAMVAIHELIEQALTEYKGITEQEITDFDIQFEKRRELGEIGDKEEPGFHPDAPYLREHSIATAVELMMCAHANVKWPDYENVVNSL